MIIPNENIFLERIARIYSAEIDLNALNDDPEQVLAWELQSYGIVKKAGDTAEAYTLFFRATEDSILKHIYKADKVSRWHNIIVNNQGIAAHLDNLSKFMSGCKHLVIYRGSSRMANGRLLARVLAGLEQSYKTKVRVLSVDEPTHDLEFSFADSGVQCLSLKNIPQVSVRYISIVCALTKCVASDLPDSLCYWSLPLGLAFLNATIRSFPELDSIKLLHSSTKHAYCFSSLLVDTHIAGANQEYYPRRESHKKIAPFSYFSEDLSIVDAPLGSKESRLRSELVSLRHIGKILVSSLSRHEKTSTTQMMRLIKRILNRNPDVVFLRCGRESMTEKEHNLAKDYPDQFVDIGWNNLNMIVDLLHIYIDPIPDGGGFSLILSMANGIPCIMPNSYDSQLSSSPSPRYLFEQDFAKSIDVSFSRVIFPHYNDVDSIVQELSSQPNTAQKIGEQCKIIHRSHASRKVNYQDYIS